MPVALAELAIPLARQLGRRVLQRLDEPEADHIARIGVARHGGAEIGARGLDAARDERGRIEERAVPVEDDELVAAGAQGHATTFDNAWSRRAHASGIGASSSMGSPLDGCAK